MSEIFEQIEQLYESAEDLPDGPAKAAVLEEAVRLADAAGDLDWQFATRLDYIDASFSSGEADKMLVAISWCIAMHAEHEGRFDGEVLVQACVFALAYISSFPNVSRQQIHQLLDDVEGRFQAEGAGPRTMHRHRFFNAFWLGDTDEAQRQLAKLKAAPKDWFWEGECWERLVVADGYIRMFQYQRAFDEARPTLEAEGDSEGTYPWLASFMLVPLVRLDKLDEAAEAHRRAYPMIDKNPKFVELVGDHIAYLTVVGELPRAMSLMERHLQWALEAASIRGGFQMKLACLMLCHQVIAGGSPETTVRLPADLKHLGEDGTASISALRDWLDADTKQLAAQFNERNGNEFFNRIIEENMSLVR